ncbi:hypothetical protein L6R49_25035 [Myxococcota bacterium]|nr:hypothetical protein [Myxococcota bacterium]
MNRDVFAVRGDLTDPRPQERPALVHRPRGEQSVEPIHIGAQLRLTQHDRPRLLNPSVEHVDLGLELIRRDLERVDAARERARVDGAQGQRVHQPIELLALLIEEAPPRVSRRDERRRDVAEPGVHLVQQGAQVGDRQHMGLEVLHDGGL